MSHYQPIACELHDYVEIACLHGYRLLIELEDGNALKAKAVTTRATDGEEFLVIDGNQTPGEIRLDRLAAITPLDNGAVFGRVVLKNR
jgi:Rho-binding antiterminator